MTDIKQEQTNSKEDIDFRDLLENANDIVQSVDPDGRFIYVNQAWCETLGYSKEEAANMSFLDILDEECEEHCSMIFARVMQGENVGNIETTFIARDGSKITVEGNCNCQFRDGKPYRTRGIFRNISERKMLEERLRQAQKLESLGIMSGGIAHEYNNMLMGIMGFIELILQKKDIDPTIRRYAQNIDRSAKRAAKLTNQILSYAGQGCFNEETLDVKSMIRNMEKVLLAGLPKNITLNIDMEAHIPSVSGDETSLQELVIQLVNNAAESIGDETGGTINIKVGSAEADTAMLDTPNFDSTLPEGTYMFIRIEDSGKGMDKAQMTKIFDPFYTTKFAGRGLGLATAHGIAKQHDGIIKVESTPGQGSVFTVYLPADKSDRELKEKAPSENEIISLQGARKNILVIDDEMVVREVMKIMLEEIGYDVMLAENGRHAIELLEQNKNRFDLIILDMIMPDMDGPETFRNIRKILKDVPVLMCSGYSEDEVISKFKKGNIAGFIHKPYSEQSLRNKVAEILDEYADN